MEGNLPEVANSLRTQNDELLSKMINEEDPAELKNLTDLFMMNQKKKDMARINKLNNLVEIIDDEIITRVSTSPDLIEDKDLNSYLKSSQQAIMDLSNNINKEPLIQINNTRNEVNINNSGLNAESRKKVLEFVNQVLKDNEQITELSEDDYEVEE